MIYTKMMAATLDVEDPLDYSSNPDTFVANSLRRQFVGRCHLGAFVLQVLRVARVSECRARATDNSGLWYVDVLFEARVAVVGVLDVVTGATVHVTTPQILAQSRTEGTVVASVVETPPAKVLREGQVVFVRVLAVAYPPRKEAATAVGVVFACDKKAVAYALRGALTPADARRLGQLRADVRGEMDARRALGADDRKLLTSFEEMYYSYAVVLSGIFAEKGGWLGPAAPVAVAAGAAVEDLLALCDRAAKKSVDVTGVWCRDLALFRSSPLAARAKAAPKAWGAPVAAAPLAAVTEMLTSAYNFLRALNHMVAQYRDAPKSYENLWAALRAERLPPPGK